MHLRHNDKPARKALAAIMTVILTSVLCTTILCATIAFAQDVTIPQDTITGSSTSATPTDSTEYAPDGSCGAVDNPSPNSKYIVTTVVEEELGNQNPQPSDSGIKVVTCFRQTDTAIVGDKTITTSQYVDSCSPSGTGTDFERRTCQRVQVLFTESGSALLFGYISMIYKWAAGIIGSVSVLFLIWGGIEIATAGDNTGAIDSAKKRIFQSISGLVLLFLSAIILYTINPNFFTP